MGIKKKRNKERGAPEPGYRLTVPPPVEMGEALGIRDSAADILTALRAEGIKDAEQARDLIADYNALAAQYQRLHQKYEQGRKVEKLGGIFLCPDCHRKTHPGNSYCWNCGLRIDWG